MNEQEKKLLAAAEAAEEEYKKALQAIQQAYRQVKFPDIDAGIGKLLAFIEENPEYLETQERLAKLLDEHGSKIGKMADTLAEFEKKHKATIDIISDTESETMQRFLDGLTVSDLKEAIGLDMTEEMIEKFKADRKDFILSLPVGECIALFEHKNNRYRTRARAAEKADIISKLPKHLAVPTAKGYQFATSLFQQGNAYLQQFKGIENLRFKDGRLYFPDTLQLVSEVELQNMRTKEGITEIDLPLLRVFYNAILSEFYKTGILKDIVSVFVPELAESMGLKRNLSRKDVELQIVAKVQSFHNVTGILKGIRRGKPSASYYQVLNFEWYNEDTNTIAFSSPYMNLVIQTIFDVSIRTTKAGQPKLKSNGEPMRLPSHSYLINTDIVKERNKAAIENVIIIVTLIEQAGDYIPRIKASTIIERNPQLQERINASNDAGTILKRVFIKTWELLRTRTRLAEVYEDIELPDPNNPANIPTLKTLDEIVFTFPHKGKRKE